MRVQMNVIKTTIVISVLFVVCWLPFDVYTLLLSILPDLTFMSDTYYALMFLAFLNICMNPFIYAARYDVIRHYWIRMIPCRQVDVSPSSHQSSVIQAVSAQLTL
jgi:pilus assembly protein TadC